MFCVVLVDIGGGIFDVMIVEYCDLMLGTGIVLLVKKFFQDGILIVGDDVCWVIVEDIVFD